MTDPEEIRQAGERAEALRGTPEGDEAEAEFWRLVAEDDDYLEF